MQKCIAALNQKGQSSAENFFIDTSGNDEDVKTEIETKLAEVDQFSQALLKFTKDITAESDIMRGLIEGIEDPIDKQTAGNTYLEFMQNDQGPMRTLFALNDEVKRLQNESVRLRQLLDATNTRIAMRNGTPVSGNPI